MAAKTPGSRAPRRRARVKRVETVDTVRADVERTRRALVEVEGVVAAFRDGRLHGDCAVHEGDVVTLRTDLARLERRLARLILTV